MKIYLMCGLIFEIVVLRNYLKSGVPYTRKEILLGFVTDLLVWPVFLLAYIMRRIRKGEKE